MNENWVSVQCRTPSTCAPVVEVIFSKQELLELCRDAGLRLEREWPSIPYDVFEATGRHSTAETYLFSV